MRDRFLDPGLGGFLKWVWGSTCIPVYGPAFVSSHCQINELNEL